MRNNPVFSNGGSGLARSNMVFVGNSLQGNAGGPVIGSNNVQPGPNLCLNSLCPSILQVLE